MALIAISALPASTTIITTDVLPFVRAGTTDKITAGNLRTQLFAFAATDPLSCGILTVVGDSTITGQLSGITTLTCSNYRGSGATMIVGPTSAHDLALYSNNTVRVTIRSGGIMNIGHTVDTGSSAGEVAIANNKGFRGLNAAATTARHLIGVNSSDKVLIDGDGIGATFGAGAVFVGAVSGITTLAITSTITGVTAITMSGTLTMSASSSKLVPGATSFSHRNNGDSADNLLISDAGVVTVRAGLTITAGGATVTAGNVALTAGNLTFAAASAKLIPGVTNFSLRNNGDSADNLLVTDAGVVTIRSTLSATAITASSGGFNASAGAAVYSVAGTQVVGARVTGFTNAWTGAAADKATAYDAASITLPQLAARVRALQEVMASSTGHGLLGV